MLKGNKVVLRPLRMDDLPARLHMINDPAVQRMTIGLEADQSTAEDLESWMELVLKDPYSEQWAIETIDGKFIGDIDLHSINVVKGEAWISPMVGDLAYIDDPAYRKEAIALIAAYAFRTKDIERLDIDIPNVDEQGLQILQELGFHITEEMDMDLLTGVKTVSLELHPEDFVYREVHN